MLRVEIADTPDQHERGLMFVKEMEADKGMLFLFKRPQPLSFWGYHTYIPLDVAYINAKNEIVKIGKITPHCLSPVSSDSPCIAAIEANAGFFSSAGIKVGDVIRLEMPNSPRLAYQLGVWDGAVIHFDKGFSTPGKKTTGEQDPRLKQSQMVPQTPMVDKQDANPVGQPVKQEVDGVNLPVLDIGDLSSILEDSFDEPEETQPQPEQPEQPEEEPEKPYPTFSNVFDAVEWAKQSGEVVRISYTTKHGRALVRDVEPHGTFHSQSTSREILVTYDETVGDIRAFIMGNISRWAFPGRQFQKKFVVKA